MCSSAKMLPDITQFDDYMYNRYDRAKLRANQEAAINPTLHIRVDKEHTIRVI